MYLLNWSAILMLNPQPNWWLWASIFLFTWQSDFIGFLLSEIVIQLFGNFLVYLLYHGSVFQCVCLKFHYFVLVCYFMFNQALKLLFHSSSLVLHTASYVSHNWASLQTYRFRLWVWLGLVCCSLTGLKTTFGLNDIHLAFPVPKFCRQSFIG